MSPHLDDAALSCAALLERDAPLTVLDVCTQRPEPEQFTEWDARSGFEGSHAAMAVREQEHAKAFAGSDHELRACGLLDSQYRGDAPRDERDLERFALALLEWVDDAGGTSTVALPAGAGLPVGDRPTRVARLRARRRHRFLFNNSPDHLWARDMGIQALADQPQVTVWLYEELPYRFALRADRIVPQVARWAERDLKPVTLAVDRRLKAARIAAYESQLPLLFRGTSVAQLPKRLPKHERYWALARR